MKVKNDVITLITKKTDEDKDGFPVDTILFSEEIMAEVKSVKYTEFYEAERAGVKVQIMAKIRIDEYEGAFISNNNKIFKPSIVIYDGIRYKIIRCYKRRQNIEMTLQEIE